MTKLMIDGEFMTIHAFYLVLLSFAKKQGFASTDNFTAMYLDAVYNDAGAELSNAAYDAIDFLNNTTDRRWEIRGQSLYAHSD